MALRITKSPVNLVNPLHFVRGNTGDDTAPHTPSEVTPLDYDGVFPLLTIIAYGPTKMEEEV